MRRFIAAFDRAMPEKVAKLVQDAEDEGGPDVTGPKEERPDALAVPPSIRWPHYYSTSCMHGLHRRCRGECKFCPEKCRCECHREKL